MPNLLTHLTIGDKNTTINSVHYIVGTGSTAGTWLGTDKSITEYYDGLTVAYKIPVAGANPTTLNITGSAGTALGAKTVYRNASSNITTHYGVGSVVLLVYTTNSSGTGSWQCVDYDSNTNVTHSGIGICSTAASTAAKVVTLPNFALVTNQNIILRVNTTNSATSGVTLNVNSTGAKSIKIGGSAWSTSNQLNAGDYLATYDGTYWNLTRIYLTDTNTKVTSADNHYTPSANSSSELTASLSGTAGSYAKDTEYTVLTGVKAQRDAKGHVTGITYTAQKIKDTNTTYESLKNPYSLGFKVNSETSAFVSYDGSAAKTITVKPSATAGAFIISDGTANKTIQLAGKFTDSNDDTTYTIATGDSNGQIKVTPSVGTAYNVSVKGLGSAAYTDSTAYAAASHGTHVTAATVKSALGVGTGTSKFLREDGTWITPTQPTKSSWNYDDVYVKYSAAQSLTDTQKTQARSNIGAGTSNLTIGTTSTTAAAGNHTHSGYATSDTKNTTGATAWSPSSSSAKLYLVGAESQATNPVTYSNLKNYIAGSGQFCAENGMNVWGELYFPESGSMILGDSILMQNRDDPDGRAEITIDDEYCLTIASANGPINIWGTELYFNGSPVVTEDTLNTLGARLIFQRKEQDPLTGLYTGEWRDDTIYTEYTSSTSATIPNNPVSSYSTYSRYVLEITRGHVVGSCSVSAGTTGMSVQSLGSYRYKIQFLNSTSTYQKVTIANGTKTITLQYKFNKSGYID